MRLSKASSVRLLLIVLSVDITMDRTHI
jgi:hypothetical protein